ncbi:response regulator transcription factor [Achromobacter xylosoxidans]|uniref:response regulator transcription factor n=1 Tax=Alcaligenes xylosoxydans xylosoxydans TaxID=85698 RepID=UPI001905578E|nr:response regulator transcription factor [Achromobacter xylosoxidans]MBK1980375.1 response regulator transcription factor [Achromobacter xylosoxidans]
MKDRDIQGMLMKSATIVLADDHPIATAGVRYALSRFPNYRILGEARSSDELIDLISTLRPDVVITDYNMPGSARLSDGLRMIAYLRRTFPDVGVVVLTVMSSASVTASLYRLGVAAVLVKTGSLEDLSGSIDRTLQAVQRSSPDGGIQVSRQQASVDILSKLTRKELEVLRELFSGLSVSQIAKKQQRSIKTISAQKVSAMRKLGTSNDHELIMFLAAHHLFT